MSDDTTRTVAITWPEFKKLAAIRHAASRDTTRPTLAAVHIETDPATGVRFVATDSYVLATRLDDSAVASEPFTVTIFATTIDQFTKTVTALTKHRPGPPSPIIKPKPANPIVVHIRLDPDVATLSATDHAGTICTITAQPAGATYPNWRRLIAELPAMPSPGAIRRMTLPELQDAAIAWRANIHLPADASRAQWVDRLLAYREQFTNAAERRAVGINPHYLARLTKTAGITPNGPPFVFETRGTAQPARLTIPTDDAWLAVIMPVRTEHT